jgi:hypothetical protein
MLGDLRGDEMRFRRRVHRHGFPDNGEVVDPRNDATSGSTKAPPKNRSISRRDDLKRLTAADNGKTKPIAHIG